MIIHYPGKHVWDRLFRNPSYYSTLASINRTGKISALLLLLWGSFLQVQATCDVTLSIPADACVGESFNITFQNTDATAVYPVVVTYTIDGGGPLTVNLPSAAAVDVAYMHGVAATIAIQITGATDDNGGGVACSVPGAASNITINALPVVTFTPPADLCVDAGVQAGLSGGSPAQGTVLGDIGLYSGAGVTDNADGTYDFDPTLLTPGPITITYTYKDGNGCTSSSANNVEVFPLPGLTALNPPADACEDGPLQSAINGGVMPMGGTYSGPGVSDGGNGMTYSFNPAAAGPGTKTITYTYTDGNGCTNTTTATVDVFALPALSGTLATPTNTCIDGVAQGPIAGGVSPNGGVFSGPGILDGGNGSTYNFNPATAGAGVHTITYTFTDGNGCVSTSVGAFEVYALPTLTALTPPADACVDAAAQLNIAGGVTPAGGVYSGDGVTDDGNGTSYDFNPAAAGVGTKTITYTFSDVNGCTNTITATVEVFALPTVGFTALADLCVDAGVQAGLGGGTPPEGTVGGDNGVYSGDGVTDDGNGMTYSFDPAAAGVGTHTITYTYTDDNGCTASASDDVEVFALPNVTFTAPADLCVDATALTGVGGGTPTGGVYSGPGVTDDGNGMTFSFDPSVGGAGTKTITYTFTDANGCTNSANDDVEAFPLPIVNATPTAQTCPNINDGNIVFFATAAGGGNITTSYTFNGGASIPIGTNPSGFPQLLSNLAPGTYVIQAVDDNSCVGTSTVTVAATVDNTPPTMLCVAGPLTFALDASGSFTLTTGDIDNGSNDACGAVTLSLSKTAFDCSDVLLGTQTITLTGTDPNGNSATCDTDITIVDTQTPVITFCPADITVDNDPLGCTADVTVPLLTATDNCPVTITNDFNAGGADASGTYPVGTTTVTFTVTDQGGLSTSCSVDITVNDTENPTAVCPVTPITFALPATGSTDISLSPAWDNSFDNCTVPANLITNFYPNGLLTPKTIYDCSDVGTHNITIEVIDEAGLTNTCGAIIVVEDNIAPTVACQDITVQLDAAGLVTIAGTDVDDGSTDNCGIASYTLDQTTFNCGDVGANTVTLTVTDVNGNSNTCTATVTVEDIIPPVVVCQDVTLQLDASGQAVLTTAAVDNGSTDNCGIASITLSKTNFTCADIGTETVTMEVTDVNGLVSTCNADITIEDNISPTIVCQDITIFLDGTGNASITPADVDGGTTDNCGPPALSLDVFAFTCADVGANTVTLTADDGNGQVVTCTATVTVLDNELPDAQCKNVAVTLDATGNASITVADVDNGSTDNCGILSIVLDKTDFTCTDVGPNTVTMTVTDVNGNVNVCTSTVTVTDNIAPDAQCADLTVFLNAAGTVTVDPAIVGAASSDVCGIASYALTQSIFTCADIGANVVTLTVTDNSGLTSTCNSTITVVDNVAPSAVCQNITVSLDATGNATITAADVDGGSTDACNPTPTLSIDVTSFTCADIGPNNVTLTVDDGNGNTSSCVAVVTIVDDEDPIALCGTLTVQLDAAGNASLDQAAVDALGAGSTDNCGIASYALSQTTFTCADVGANPLVLTVTDVSGNTSVCTALITVEDNVAPVALCQDVAVSLDAAGNASITVADVNNGSSDACGIASIALSQTAFTCADVGANTVTMTVTDVNGNSSICTSTVTVTDDIDPVITCGADITVPAAPGLCEATVTIPAPTFTDNCTGADFTVPPVLTQTFSVGVHIIPFTVVDASGNTASCSITITVEDTEDPVIVCGLDVVINADPGECGATYFYGPGVGPTASDNCPNPQVNLAPGSIGSGGFFPVGVTTETYTVTDAAGNTASCSFTVTVIDNQAPTFAPYADITVGNDPGDCGAIVNFPAPTPLDNCPVVAPTLTSLLGPGNFFPVGTTTVSYSYSDGVNPIATISFDVTVNDTELPVITCPADITETGNALTCDAVVNYTINAPTDNCNPAPTFSLIAGLASGESFPVGTTVVTYQADDGNGNIGTCSFNVTVTPAVAPTQAAITAPPTNINDVAEVCVGGSLVLAGNAPAIGEVGSWTLIGDPAATFTGGANNPNATLTNLLVATTNTPHTLIWTISDNCSSTHDTIFVQVNPLPSGNIVEVQSISAFGASDGQLLAVPIGGTPTSYTFQWDDPLNQTANPAVGLATGTYNVVITDGAGCSSAPIPYFLDQPAIDAILVDLTVFLQGAYDDATDLMDDGIRLNHAADLVNEPYSGATTNFPPFPGFVSYTPIAGASANMAGPGVLAVTGPQAVVDWVWVELRDKDDPTNILGAQAALVLRNGSVVDAADGVSPVGFALLPDNYYIAIRHRNHLGVMTATPLTVTTSTATSVDFTNLATPTFGSEPQRQDDVDPVFALWAGDSNGDKQVLFGGPATDDLSVLATVGTDPGNTFGSLSYIVNEYRIEDLNLDGNVIYSGGTASDVNVIFLNIFLHPNNTSFSLSFIISEQIPN